MANMKIDPKWNRKRERERERELVATDSLYYWQSETKKAKIPSSTIEEAFDLHDKEASQAKGRNASWKSILLESK